MFCSGEHDKSTSESSSSLQIAPDLLGVFSVETLALLVELLVTLVDVADVCVVHVRPSPAVFGTLRDLPLDIRRHFIQRRGTHFT